MIVKLLTDHHLEFLSFKGGCTDLRVYTCQNVTLLEITCHGSNHTVDKKRPNKLIEKKKKHYYIEKND